MLRIFRRVTADQIFYHHHLHTPFFSYVFVFSLYSIHSVACLHRSSIPFFRSAFLCPPPPNTHTISLWMLQKGAPKEKKIGIIPKKNEWMNEEEHTMTWILFQYQQILHRIFILCVCMGICVCVCVWVESDLSIILFKSKINAYETLKNKNTLPQWNNNIAWNSIDGTFSRRQTNRSYYAWWFYDSQVLHHLLNSSPVNFFSFCLLLSLSFSRCLFPFPFSLAMDLMR